MSKEQPEQITLDEYLDGIEELRNTQGWQIQRKIDRLQRSLYIFNANYNELINGIQPEFAEFLVLFDVSNRMQMENLLIEVTRKFHNFVAAAKMLVDHMRNIARDMYEGTAFWSEYEAEVKQRFELNSMVRFVHGLRDYFLHKDLPLTSADLTSTYEMSLRINIASLREWNKWNAVARKYLDAANEDEKIEDIVDQYVRLVMDFHNWFYNRQLELHKDAFKEAEDLRQRLINSPWHLKEM